MKGKIAAIFVLTLLIAPILNAAAYEIEENNLDQVPSTPIIDGPCEAEIGETCFYTVTSTDPQGDDLFYVIRYSDDPSIKLRDGPFKSGEIITFPHCWDVVYQDYNPFVIQVMAIDEYDHESDWGRFEVNMTNSKIGKVRTNNDNITILFKTSIFQFFEKLIERFPLIERLFNL
jgi:hypothetical protein